MRHCPLGSAEPGIGRRAQSPHIAHKIPGPLHLHCRPENTQPDSVGKKKKPPGLCFLMPVCKNNSPAARNHGECVLGRMLWAGAD